MCKILRNCTCSKDAPDWITQTREQICDEEIRAAETHLTWYNLIIDGVYPDTTIAGGKEHHVYWYYKHLEAAWWDCPSRFLEQFPPDAVPPSIERSMHS